MARDAWASDRTVVVELPALTYGLRSYREQDTGAEVDEEDTCTCGHDLADGDLIRWRAGRPEHVACYVREVEAMELPNAWCAIAEDIKRNPSRHSAATVRAVLENLSALVTGSRRQGLPIGGGDLS